MLFQDALTQRIFIVIIVQIWPIFYCSYFTYKLLKRGRNRSTLTLGSFFLLVSITYFFATISIFFLNTPLSYLFYILGIYFFIYSHSFFVILSWVILKLDQKSSYWKFHIIITGYGILSTYVFWIGFFFNGIKYDASTNWIPTYSFFFFLFSWAFLFIFIVIPQIYFTIKLLRVFKGVKLKQRINRFISSIFLELSMVFSIFLYNFWVENQLLRSILILIMPISGTIAGFLIYKSFGKNLE